MVEQRDYKGERKRPRALERPGELSGARPGAAQRRFEPLPQERRAIEEYLTDLNGPAAFARAGLDPARANRFFGNPRVMALVALAKRQRVGRLQLYADAHLRSWELLYNADPRELVENRRCACRRCHDAAYQRARAAHETLEAELHPADRQPFAGDEWPTFASYDRYADPNPACLEPACRGVGELRTIIRDTRHLSPGGVRLFNGVKVGTGGAIQVLFRDRDHAGAMVAKLAGFINERRSVDEFDPARMTSDQLDAALFSMVEKGTVEIESSSDDESLSSSDDLIESAEEVLSSADSSSDAEFVDLPRPSHG